MKKRRTVRHLLAGFVFAWLMLGGRHALAQPCGGYEVRAIIQAPKCPPFGYPPMFAWGLNEEGWVVGSFRACVIGPDVAWIWTPELGMQVIPMPAGTSYSRAVAISGSLIVGEYDNAQLELGRTGFLYDFETDQFTSLGTLPGGNTSAVGGINATGEIVGLWGDIVNGPFPLAFIWRDGKMIDINPDIGAASSEANHINVNGAITGWSRTDEGERMAFVWEDGKVTELPPIPGGFTSEGEAISNCAQVAGRGEKLDGDGSLLVRAFVWNNGKMIELGTLRGFIWSAALAITPNGRQIVGLSWNMDGNPNIRRAFVWADGKMIDLNDLIPADLGLNITFASGINEAGQIACTALDRFNDNVAVLLTPITGPAGDLNGDCTVGASDLLLLLSSWGRCDNCEDCPADLDNNCVVGASDLLTLLLNWG